MLGTDSSPLRVAIVGAGPSGFYAAGHLLKNKTHPELAVAVDLYDRLPTPFGLVRAGVAPDHPKIKSVTRVYDKIAADPRFRFFGGVQVGRDLKREELLSHYHAVIYTVGAQTDRRLGVIGEDLPGSYPATIFVAWYNGHPDAADVEFDLSAERAVVIGNGNVAIDVARMLLLPREELEATDTAERAIEAIAGAGVREVVICGRRGPAQAAFTNPELLELGEMEDVDVIVDPADLEIDETSQKLLDANATRRKNVEILRDYAARPLKGASKRIVLRFCVSPAEIGGDGKVERVVIGHNELVTDEHGEQYSKPKGTRETIEAGLVFRAVGYRGVQLDGVPFDERTGLIRNVGGRITGEDGHPRRGEYTAGWIKRGPSGVIGTNKKCAQDTVDLLLDDMHGGALPPLQGPEPAALDALLAERGIRVVDWAGWQAIDAEETAAGAPKGRPRVKRVTYEELHAAAKREGEQA